MLFFSKFVLICLVFYVPVGYSSQVISACYFTDWSIYRPGYGSYNVSEINVCDTKCTHLIYSFAKYNIEKNTLEIVDIGQGFVPILTSCKKYNKKVLLAVGGWTYSEKNLIQPLFSSHDVIDQFVQNSITFLTEHSFDGLDLDMEYPSCWQMECDATSGEKESFAYLVKTMKSEFKKHGLMLTVAVSPNQKVIDVAYDVKTLNEYADWIGIMAYDYYSYNDKKTGLVAPFNNQPDEKTAYSVQSSVELWINHGAKHNKLVLGIPLYGKSFKLDLKNQNGLNAPASGAPILGQFTKEAGILSFMEICLYLKKNNWNEVFLKDLGSYAYKQLDWVGYDNVSNIKRKAQYILDLKLAGAMFWALDLDDFRNVCGYGKYPLLTAFDKTVQWKCDNTL
ncbi:probable chitinase 10 [Daktulosphaira vitifoliae]|uniref:probable chitinase 10 n=1 Tax=Daktulosphaira vitifoliae TaxID=58002 RepID=UPI0021AA2276|nr:probable chitinase 10 [Daktulosphaira vitifoliae]